MSGSTGYDDFKEKAFDYWNVEEDPVGCPEYKVYQMRQEDVILKADQTWTDDLTTLFTPLCESLYPKPTPEEQFWTFKGFSGETGEDIATWFFKWYFRLDETWSVEGTYG